MENSTKDNIYIIEMPGKPSREVTNINYEKVSLLVEKQGGTIYLKSKPAVVVPKTSMPYTGWTGTPIPKFTMSVSTNYRDSFGMSVSEAMKLVDEIKSKHFSDCEIVMNCPVKINNRLTRALGRASWRRRRSWNAYTSTNSWHFCNFSVSLSGNMLRNNPQYVKQVIYHEFLHVMFPMEKHTGPNFRYHEKNNPYRINKNTNRLSCVS